MSGVRSWIKEVGEGRGGTHGAVRVGEHLHAVTRVLPLVFGHMGLEDGGDDVPELVVLVPEQDDEASGLGVEGAGDVLDGDAQDLLDLLVVDGAVLVQLVDGATVLDRVPEGGLVVRHVVEGSWGRGEAA